MSHFLPTQAAGQYLHRILMKTLGPFMIVYSPPYSAPMCPGAILQGVFISSSCCRPAASCRILPWLTPLGQVTENSVPFQSPPQAGYFQPSPPRVLGCRDCTGGGPLHTFPLHHHPQILLTGGSFDLQVAESRYNSSKTMCTMLRESARLTFNSLPTHYICFQKQ